MNELIMNDTNEKPTAPDVSRLVRPLWLMALTEEVREASKAFKDDWPAAWIFLGDSESNDSGKDWYDWPEPLLGLPVYHCPAFLRHSGYDGEHQRILPLWKGDVSGKSGIIREFECRLAKSGDF